MRLYSGSSSQFIDDTARNQIAGKLRQTWFDYFGYEPSPGELASWQNSTRAIADVFRLAELTDHGVLLEYQLPMSSKRLDCMITGCDGDGSGNAVIVELKQWGKCTGADGVNEVSTWVGGSEREVLHPCAQVRQYKLYLEDTHTAFQDDDALRLHACSYLHNYYAHAEDPLKDTKFDGLLSDCPLFSADDVDPLSAYLSSRLSRGDGMQILDRVEEGSYRPSKKLLEHVAGVIKGNSEYVLLDEQLVVYDKVLACAEEGFGDRKTAVLIVKGGPGTGKSVIAINLMADLALRGLNTHYATGSRAFTETLRKVIGSRGSVQFKYFNSYMDADPNAVDVLICDEAHRIREKSYNRFTPKKKRVETPQVDQLINAGKVVVFLLDDDQVVRPNEIGSVDFIRTSASEKSCKLFEYELETQFRCQGSDAFVNWVNNTLGVKRTANALWTGTESFDFRILGSPDELEREIAGRAQEGYSARMTAGFCWPWSKTKPDGTLEEDVVIGEYRRPWNARPEARKLANGIPKATLWAHDPSGMEQVGCVYTAQGFEFDYVGVIFGTDLVYDLDAQTWIGHKDRSFDTVVKRSGDKFLDLVKNTYRVLLTRGMLGCYVCFMDKDTERFVKSRIEGLHTSG
ncbi:MAG: DUF2075 domain-containing protein [Armatimonadetes bacterium]|nr:DUF2075 domain-containing protein [Armatimonadota bacterium]